MTVSAKHHLHPAHWYAAHHLVYDRVFALGVVIALLAIGAAMVDLVIAAVITFIRTSSMPIW